MSINKQMQWSYFTHKTPFDGGAEVGDKSRRHSYTQAEIEKTKRERKLIPREEAEKGGKDATFLLPRFPLLSFLSQPLFSPIRLPTLFLSLSLSLPEDNKAAMRMISSCKLNPYKKLSFLTPS